MGEWISSELEAVAPGGTDYLGDYIAPKHLHVGDRREVRISPHLDPGDTALEGGDQTRSPDFPAADPSGRGSRPVGPTGWPGDVRAITRAWPGPCEITNSLLNQAPTEAMASA